MQKSSCQVVKCQKKKKKQKEMQSLLYLSQKFLIAKNLM